MITRIEIDGFKTFKDFTLDLEPFQVIVGANGSGKSNLFDALRLLSRLSYSSLQDAFRGLRGKTDQLFSLRADGTTVDRMSFAVELLLDSKVTDWRGKEATLHYNRVRYKLTFKRNNNRIEILEETLASIPSTNDEWAKRHGINNDENEVNHFIITKFNDDKNLLNFSEDPIESNIDSEASKAEATILNLARSIRVPHALATFKAFQEISLLRLQTEDLRGDNPSNRRGFSIVEEIGLPQLLARLGNNLLKEVDRDLANLIPGITGIDLSWDRTRDDWLISIKTQDGLSIPWQSLSDGTLRMLALATLANYPDLGGLLCVEEPENGVHPSVLGTVAKLLRRMATDFSKPDQLDKPLRQVLVSTHSPVLISQPEVVDSLLYAYIVTRVQGGKPDIAPIRVTRISPVKSSKNLKNTNRETMKEGFYTLTQVKKYLEMPDYEYALAQLEEGVS